MINYQKPKLAIIDLTDCEGCQAEFFSLKDKLPQLINSFEIVSWRMAQDKSNLKDIDICLIEGTSITQSDRKRIVEIRKKASIVGTLGSCADLGGINAILKGRQRDKAFKKVYSKNKPTKREVQPVSKYIDVDFKIPGCPIRPDHLAKILAKLLIGKIPHPEPYPVCFECKLQGNRCLLLNGQECLGPITAGGCQAICPSQDYPCLGCFGKIKGAQDKQLKKKIEEITSKKEAEKIYQIFLNNFN